MRSPTSQPLRGIGQIVRPRQSVYGLPEPRLITRLGKGMLLLFCCAVIVVPLLSVVATSFASAKQVTEAGGFVLWPTHPTIAAYRSILSGGVVARSLVVSIGITSVGTFLSLAVTTLLAYALSRPGSVGHKPALMAVILTLFFAPGIIPNYLLVKQLGLLNSYWSLILPVLISGFNVVVIRAFFLELPQELIDSAKMDGADDFQILLRIVLPLSKAVLAVMALFYGVAYWNSFFNALIYLNDDSKWPLQLILRQFVVNNTPISSAQLTPGTAPPPQQTLQSAILVMALIPILIVYPFAQRHFIKGVLTGAIKG